MANRAAEDAEERYRRLVELAPDGISISHESRIVFANSALARMLGAESAQELIGRTYREIVHPDSLPLVEARRTRVLAGENAPWLEEKWLRLDGSTVEVESAAVPITQGGTVLVQLFTRDLTARKEAENELHEHQRRLQKLFDLSIDGIFLIDDDGHYVDVNPAAVKLLGYSKEEWRQMKVGDVTPEDKKAQVSDFRRRIFGELPTYGEYVVAGKDGTRHIIESQTLGYVSPGLHYVIVHDITRLKQAEESLRSLSLGLLRSQDEERHRISRQLHETTAQSLAALRMNLSRLKEISNVPRDIVDDSIELTEQSIKEIRTLSYLLHPPLMDELGLKSALQWYASGFEQRSGIAVAVDIADDIGRLAPEIETTVFRVVQEALTNIHRHAESPVAAIRLQYEDGTLIVEIEDHGHGFPENAVDGVGIAGMQERIRQLHGEMTIRSSAEGATILVKLPVAK